VTTRPEGRRSRSSLRRAERERGFTLVELLITISILAVIIGVLATAFVTAGRSTIGVSARYSQSHDAQMVSAFLATDVQSNAALTSAVCGSGGSDLINFGYADGSVVTYAFGSDGGETRLTRRVCSGGSVTTAAVLVHNGGGTPTLTCDGVACSVGGTPQPNKVTINVPDRNRETGADDYTFTLTGTRRACVNTVSGTPTTAPCSGSTSNPPPPAPYGLIALNNGRVSLNGNNSHLTVHGPMVIDSTNPSSAVSIGGNQNPSTPRVRVLDPQGGPGYFGIRQGGGCSTCTSNNISPHPWTVFTDPIVDPFQGLPYPDEAGLPVYTDGANHGPGVYRTLPLSFTGNNQQFHLDPGIYILEAGISMSGNGNVLSGTDVMLFNGCGRNSSACAAGTGSGTFSFTGQSTLVLDPYQSGQYQFLLLWQPMANPQPITIAGGAEASLLRGIVYAPGSSGLSIGSGNATLQIWCVAGTVITLSGNGEVVVGQ
jgi:prepilin-type N-terminal cleavage/methylation domain-containing protein